MQEQDGDALNSIDWKKISITKSGLTKQSNWEKSLKPGDIVYHTNLGYLLIEKLAGNEEDVKSKWECKVLHKTSEMQLQDGKAIIDISDL